MAQQSKIASRYAKAVLNCLPDGKATETQIAELKTIQDYFVQNPHLFEVLTLPVLNKDKRRLVLSDFLEKIKCSKLTEKVCLTLFDMKRFGLFNAVLERLVQINLEQSQKVYLQVSSSQTLSGEQKEALEKKFFHILKKPVVANYEIDLALIGGVKVLAEGKTYDGSVEGWLGSIRALD